MLKNIIIVGLCAAVLVGCGKKTPQRGPIQTDRKKHANGQFAAKVEYYFDATGKAVKHGREAKYFKNGNFHVRGYNMDGKSVGTWEEFYPDGFRKGVVNFKDGEVDGKIAMWHPNGQLQMTGENLNGLQIGDWLYYNEAGQVVKKQVFKKGEQLSEQVFKPAPIDPKSIVKPAWTEKPPGICDSKAIPDPKPEVDPKAPTKDEATNTAKSTPEDETSVATTTAAPETVTPPQPAPAIKTDEKAEK